MCWLLGPCRYGLRSQTDVLKRVDPELRALLEEADAEKDLEARGDLLGEALLLRVKGSEALPQPTLKAAGLGY